MLNNKQQTTNNKQQTTNNKQQTLILFLLMILLGSSVYSQRSNPNENNITPNGVLDKVFDQTGKQYALSDLLVERSGTTLINCSSTSYFNLYFEVGSGMENSSDPAHMARRAVVCKVFEDLSSFINSPLSTNGNRVNIWVRNINNVFASPNGVLGLASAFYNLPSSSSTGGIADNEIWKTIHSGVDSYLNSTIPLTVLGGSNNQSGIFFHGMVTFNFNTTNTPAINFNTNLTATTIPSGEFDLYSAVLHEVTHALGFTSLINQDGNSVFGPNFRYYSRYDRFLKTNNSSQFLLTSSACSSMYDYVFNTALNPTVLHPNPTAAACSGNTLCNDAIKFVGTTTVPVFTPNCFNPISSLSHFEDTHFPTCNTTNPAFGNDNYFLMCNAGNPGMMRRYLKLEERNALCDIGYSVKTTFGSSSVRITPTIFGPFNYGGTTCNGISVAGINDGINNAGSYTFIGNSGTNITISGILSNDTNATGFECLQDLTATVANPTNLSTTSGTTATTVTFNSTLAGLHLLRYVPINGTQRGNITYVYVFVQPIGSSCTTTPSACNLVNNGNFEANNVNITQSTDFLFNRVCDWVGRGFSTAYFLQNNTTINYSVPCNFYGNQNDNITGNNAYAGLRCYSFFNGGQTSGILATRLSSPLTSNTNYQVRLDISQADFYKNRNYGLQVFISSLTPDQILTGMITNPQLSDGILISNTTVSNDFNDWETVSLTFTTTSIQNNLQFLYIGVLNNPLNNVGTAASVIPGCAFAFSFTPVNGSSYYIDNVSLIATGGASIELPPSICQNQNLSNLSLYINAAPANGVFSGAGVSFAGGIYSFTAAAAGVGTHTISYTYNNNLGCPVTLTDSIIVTNISTTVATVDAVNDDFSTMPINTASGGITVSVYTNDLYNGLPSSAASMPNVTFSLVSPLSIAGATINTTGLISIPAGTPSGIYTLTYSLSTIGNCNVADTATVTIIVNNIIMTPNLVAGIRANNMVELIAVQNSSKIIISGQFSKYNNINRNTIARINNDLTLDNTFLSSANSLNFRAKDIAVQDNDGIIVVGTFSSYGGASNGNNIVRLLNNGGVDPAFNISGVGTTGLVSFTNNDVYSCQVQSNGNLLIGGDFNFYNGVQRRGIARLLPNGTIDLTFNPIELNNYTRCIVSNILIQPDGNILLEGIFNAAGISQNTKLIRINSQGNIDNTFTMGNDASSMPTNNSTIGNFMFYDMALQSSGKIVVVGAFTKYNGVTAKNIIRLMPNGQVDPTFNVLTGVDRSIATVIIEPVNDNIIIGGEFTSFGSTPIKKMIRLGINGTLDTSFSIGAGTTDSVPVPFCTFCSNRVVVLKQQPDGKIIVGGRFTTFNGLSATNITRISGSAGAQARSNVTEFQSEPEINTNFETNVLVYPNPSSDVFNIDLTNVDQKFTEIFIFNIIGEKVFSKRILPNEINTINLSHLANGYYFAKLFSENGNTTIKLIKN